MTLKLAKQTEVLAKEIRKKIDIKGVRVAKEPFVNQDSIIVSGDIITRKKYLEEIFEDVLKNYPDVRWQWNDYRLAYVITYDKSNTDEFKDDKLEDHLRMIRYIAGNTDVNPSERLVSIEKYLKSIQA